MQPRLKRVYEFITGRKCSRCVWSWPDMDDDFCVLSETCLVDRDSCQKKIRNRLWKGVAKMTFIRVKKGE